MEFRTIRRIRQKLPIENCIGILIKSTSGVLSVIGDGGYPYGVPLNYFYQDGKIYFHCASSGHKLDAIHSEPKVSFTVIDKDEIVEEKFTTKYRSVIVFGRARIIENTEEMRTLLRRFTEHLCPSESGEAIEAEINKDIVRVRVIELSIEHISGKQGMELLQKSI